jgi:hypothetical protein
MNDLLTKLGVFKQIQALFNICGELVFDYGDSYEHFARTFTKCPPCGIYGMREMT